MKRFILLFIFIFSLSSCNRILFNYFANKKEVKLSKFYNNEQDKTIVFVPMVHVSTPEFYQDVKTKLDSLRTMGYVVFYESVAFDTKKYNHKELDTIYRKFRKLVGFNLTNYKDSTNKSIPKFYSNDKYISQNNDLIGIEKNDLKVDLPADTIIKLYEKKVEKIILSDCDFNTPLQAEYNCKTLNWFYAIHTFRDDFIEKKTLASDYKKIAMVYGSEHFHFYRGTLQSHGYTKVKP